MAKKARILETSSEFEVLESAEDVKDADEVNRVKQQLEAKDKECQLLASQVLGQETPCKVGEHTTYSAIVGCVELFLPKKIRVPIESTLKNTFKIARREI